MQEDIEQLILKTAVVYTRQIADRDFAYRPENTPSVLMHLKMGLYITSDWPERRCKAIFSPTGEYPQPDMRVPSKLEEDLGKTPILNQSRHLLNLRYWFNHEGDYIEVSAPVPKGSERAFPALMGIIDAMDRMLKEQGFEITSEGQGVNETHKYIKKIKIPTE